MDRRTEFLLGRWLRSQHYVLLMVTCTLLSFILGYSISVGLKDVNALFPYISDTGTIPPASCIFGLMLNLAAIFAIITMHIRHRYLEKFNTLNSQLFHILNDVAMFLGFLSAFGMMVVANFQETNVLTMHLIGALMTFCLGILYCWIQSYLSYVTIPVGMSIQLKFILQLILSFIATIFFICTFAGASAAKMEFQNSNGKNHSTIRLHWKSDEAGYTAHLVSTFAEWIMGISFVLYFLTFYGDFKRIQSCITISCVPQNGEQQPIADINNDELSSPHA